MAYPDSYPSRRDLANRTGVVYDADKTKVFYAEDHNNLIDDIMSIMTTLGLSPAGTFTTVALRLTDIESQLSGVDTKFSVRLATDQAVDTATATLLQFSEVDFDAGCDFDSDNYKFITPEAGYYQFNVYAQFDQDTADKYAYVALKKNTSKGKLAASAFNLFKPLLMSIPQSFNNRIDSSLKRPDFCMAIFSFILLFF